MALCNEACCNKEKRDALRAQREAEFEQYLQTRGARPTATPERPVEAGALTVAEQDALTAWWERKVATPGWNANG